jgi:hypothetical protein
MNHITRIIDCNINEAKHRLTQYNIIYYHLDWNNTNVRNE